MMFTLRPKTLRRLPILLGASLLLAAAIGWIYRTGMKRSRDELARSRQQAMAACQSADYTRAVVMLGDYLARGRRQDADPEALLAYGTARCNVEMPHLRHLFEAIGIFEHYLQLSPKDLQARHQLLHLYERVNYHKEALRLSDSILQTAGGDREALKTRVEALNGLGRPEDALAASEHLNALFPDDLRGQLMTEYLLLAAKRPDDAVARAEQLRGAHSADPRFETLLGAAYLLTGRQSAARELFRTASSRLLPDSEFAAQLVRFLDTCGLFDEARTVLDRGCARGNDTGLRRQFALRTLQDLGPRALIDWFAQISSVVAIGDSDVLGLYALSLFETGRPAEASGVVARLSRADADSTARGWAIGLSACFAQPARSPAALSKACRDALELCPENAVIETMLGDAYAAMGETDLAARAWRQAALKCPNWADPCLSLARVLSITGPQRAALEAAREALHRAPQRYETQIALSEAQLDALPSAASRELSDVLARLEDIENAWPGRDQTMACRVRALVASGRPEPAVALIRAALAGGAHRETSSLLRLAELDEQAPLGAGPVILDEAERHGQTPQTALARARHLCAASGSAAGLASMEDAVSRHHGTLPWKMALATYRDSIDDACAASAWSELSDANPSELGVQVAAIRSPSRFADRAFWKRTIDRIRSLTGDECLTWRREQAHWLLTAEHTDKQKAEALALLEDVVRNAPDQAEPRRLLSFAFAQVGDVRRAIEELRAALDRAPDDEQMMADLVHLLEGSDRPEEAREFLHGVALREDLSRGARLWAAQTLVRLGDFAPAIALLSSGRAELSHDYACQRLLGGLYRRCKQFDQAATCYQQLLDDIADDADAEAEAADFFAARNRPDMSAAFLDRLNHQPRLSVAAAWYATGKTFDSRDALDRSQAILAPLVQGMDATPEAMRLWAQVSAAKQDWDSASHACRVVLQADPGSAVAQNNLAYALVGRGCAKDFPEARSLAEQAVRSAPKFADAYATLGRVEEAQGNRSAAIEAFHKALRRDPGNLDAREGLADLLGRAEPPASGQTARRP